MSGNPSSATPRYHETEIKLRYDGSPEQARAMIERHGYSLIHPRTLEIDQVFDRAGELKGSNQLLRLRRAGPLATVTYKGPGVRGPHKSREEIEFNVSDPDALTLVLARLGYQPAFRYEKYRTKFAAPAEPAAIVTIDETPIGIFLELEGPPEWIDSTAVRLGYSPGEYLTSSYASLYREYRLAHQGVPANMVFPDRRLSTTSAKDT
jgi:adenylate cyclase, class 2